MLNFVNLLHCLSSKPIFRHFFKKVQSDWLLEKLTVNWKKLTANWKKLTAIWKKLTAHICCEMTEDLEKYCMETDCKMNMDSMFVGTV